MADSVELSAIPQFQRVIAVDPGKTTGVAVWEKGEFSIHQISKRNINSYLNLTMKERSIVVYETFKTRPEYFFMTRQGDAQEIIGVLKYLSDRRPGIFLKGESADHSKCSISNEFMEQKGVYDPTRQHGTDAARLLLLWCKKNKLGLGKGWLNENAKIRRRFYS